MNFAAIKDCDIANGPGVRVSLFVSGCTHRCPGCFNEVAWDFDYGTPYTEKTEEEILSLLSPGYVKGLTILGGEPMEPQNQAPLLPLLRQIRRRYPQKTIWAFTGYTLDGDILPQKLGPWEVTEEYLSLLDVLVDGPFLMAQKDLNLRFRGSANQRIIDMPATLRQGQIVLWQDWQTQGKGM